jgi:hypothetical protein
MIPIGEDTHEAQQLP